MNRIGDGFFLVCLSFMAILMPDFYAVNSFLPQSYMLPLLLILTFMTKRALYPFSSWLPMAMAAPTPISALVHSSTLVTSGLYLIIRFSYILYSFPALIKLLLIVRLFTSFYAGLNTIFELDLKKLIALSTLSHLGFIGMAFSSGLLSFSFFHLLAHALFKSLLFMCIGDIIINLSHSQDIRYLSSGVFYTPFSVLTIYVSILNLLGIPSISGFFSKDLVLESFHHSGAGVLAIFLLYLNVFFTYFYTFQLFYYSFSSNKLTPFFMFHSSLKLHRVLIFLLGLLSTVFGRFFLILFS
jgi:NADH-ubiquinone oxidoreductase chain 5